MPHLIVAPRALADLRRLEAFLKDKNPPAAQRATRAIRDQVRLLASTPALGRLVEGTHRRELMIPFADSGYVALYTYDQARDLVVIAAIRHQKEVGY